ncbi:MAG: F0F1 ATP synthase subunit A [Gemmatimonadota bacterium]|nr:F0F1 ATP synthase subunit A [Gemmatimonadota bacterium]
MTDENPRPATGTSPQDDESTAEERMRAALGPEMASDAVVAAGEVATPPARGVRGKVLLGIAVIVALQIAGLFLFPPFTQDDPDGSEGPYEFPRDAITANFELPAPHVLVDLDESLPPPPSDAILTFDLTIPSSIFTGWIVMAVIVALVLFLSLGIRQVPGKRQNLLEYVYEGLANFATSLGGKDARRYVPVFVAFFLFILLSNWSGLLPFVGRTLELRAPTSDVNVTIGLALVAFVMFHFEGVRALGVRGYLGKFFSLKGFKEGPANGVISIFVGFLEFLLEFVKPVTLSMRLWGNIYAGEIALGVISALTIFIIPVAMLGLEVLLNFMQALIFSILALMFTIAAIERHDDHEEHHEAHEPDLPEGDMEPELRRGTVAA